MPPLCFTQGRCDNCLERLALVDGLCCDCFEVSFPRWIRDLLFEIESWRVTAPLSERLAGGSRS